MKRSIPGNCLICAIILWLRHGGRIHCVRHRTGSPHFIVRTSAGTIHFNRTRNLLPGKLSYLLFLGQIERRPKSA